MTTGAASTALSAEGKATAMGQFVATVSAECERVAAIVGRAYVDTQEQLATDLAEGRHPEDMPPVGTGAEGKRLVMTATAMARRGELTPEMAASIWHVYTAAVWADEAATELAELARVVLCTGASPATPWPTETTTVDPTASSGPIGLSEPAASNAPPARPEFNATIQGGST